MHQCDNFRLVFSYGIGQLIGCKNAAPLGFNTDHLTAGTPRNFGQ